MQGSFTVFWFRRDLRLHDNRGLYEALKSSDRVLPLFIFDSEILSSLAENDHRVTFIYDAISSIQSELKERGKGILIAYGKPVDVFRTLLDRFRVEAVYCNKDHEPYGMGRDKEVENLLSDVGVRLYSFLDHLVFDRDDVLKTDGSPYMVYTPYSRRCKELLTEDRWRPFLSERLLSHVVPSDYFSGHHDIFGETHGGMSSLLNLSEGVISGMPAMADIGFSKSRLSYPTSATSKEVVINYKERRDYPYLQGTTRLGVHLRFGTIGIRGLFRETSGWSDTFWNELIWREFYAMILWHYPGVVDRSFKKEYDRIEWRNCEAEFDLWKSGNTGYAMVDAGMRQLNATGFMHNRLRMITASFLCKHLLIDWRWGEAYFSERLFDYELSSNNGGWQWSAGTGCDAAPYFRIFNPMEQQKKFDPHGDFVKAWIPELGSPDYPTPIVDHKAARERCLTTYKKALTQI